MNMMKNQEIGIMNKTHGWWRVEVSLYDGVLVAIEPEMLSGKSELTDRDIETIRAAGKHLLGFAGHEVQTDFLEGEDHE
jgi:hypothetical protein